MLFINRLKSYNFSLEEIKEILETEEAQDEKLCKALMKKKKEIDLKIQNYQNSLAQLHEEYHNSPTRKINYVVSR